jgi:hypothetical protein
MWIVSARRKLCILKQLTSVAFSLKNWREPWHFFASVATFRCLPCITRHERGLLGGCVYRAAGRLPQTGVGHEWSGRQQAAAAGVNADTPEVCIGKPGSYSSQKVLYNTAQTDGTAPRVHATGARLSTWTEYASEWSDWTTRVGFPGKCMALLFTTTCWPRVGWKSPSSDKRVSPPFSA